MKDFDYAFTTSVTESEQVIFHCATQYLDSELVIDELTNIATENLPFLFVLPTDELVDGLCSSLYLNRSSFAAHCTSRFSMRFHLFVFLGPN